MLVPAALTMRRSAARPDSCSQHTPVPPQGQSPLLVPLARKPDGTYACGEAMELSCVQLPELLCF